MVTVFAGSSLKLQRGWVHWGLTDLLKITAGASIGKLSYTCLRRVYLVHNAENKDNRYAAPALKVVFHTKRIQSVS